MDIGISLKKRADINDGTYKMLGEIGYRALEIDLSDTEDDYYTMHVDSMIAHAQGTKRALSELGMYVSQVKGPMIYPPYGKKADEKEKLFGKLFRTTLAARMLGAKYIVLRPLMPFGEDTPDGKALENSMLNKEFYRRVCDMAKDYGVVVCLENLPYGQNPLSSPAALAALVSEMNNDSLKMCLNTGNADAAGASTKEALTECVDVIKAMHVDDSCTTELLDAIKNSGYDGVFSLDIQSQEDTGRDAYALYYGTAKGISD